MPSNQINFTKATIASLPIPSKLTYYYDVRTRGLALRVEPSGQKAFYLYRPVNGQPKMRKLGLWPEMSVEAARDKAHILNAAILNSHDIDRAAGKQRGGMTFDELGEAWVAYKRKKNKKSWELDRWMLSTYLAPLSRRQLSAINKAEMRRLHADIGDKHGEQAANRAFELARAMFNYAKTGIRQSKQGYKT